MRERLSARLGALHSRREARRVLSEAPADQMIPDTEDEGCRETKALQKKFKKREKKRRCKQRKKKDAKDKKKGY